MSRNPKVVSFNRSAAYVHHRAMMNRRDNNIMDALELMRRAVEESPENREYRLDLAELYCEMGCHEQSRRLLLDMLAEENRPSECYYGLALNQLGVNDITGAQSLLWLYRRSDPAGARVEEVRQLAAQLDFYIGINRHGNRRLHRATAIANRACEAMRADQPRKACRLFRQSLRQVSGQPEVRALYAMALLVDGESELARAQADRAVSKCPPSVRALCLSAQVFYLLGDADKARALVRSAAREKPEEQDLRMLIYSMGVMDMDGEVAEYTRLALHDAPYDRDLLHMNAVALKRLGAPDERVARFWTRILRIDPEDSIAQYYQQAALNGRLDACSLDYGYQVPREEFVRRLRTLLDHLSQGYEHIESQWHSDPSFRQLVRWAVGSEDARLSRAAMTALTTIDHTDSRSLLRSLLFGGELSDDMKLHAALALRLQGIDANAIMPADAGLGTGLMPDAQIMLSRLGVGERQLVRYADEVLRDCYDVSALNQLAMMWMVYRQSRRTAVDPLRCVGGGAAALAYNYMLLYGPKPEIAALARDFGCDERQLVYYARRIAGCLERIRTE